MLSSCFIRSDSIRDEKLKFCLESSERIKRLGTWFRTLQHGQRIERSGARDGKLVWNCWYFWIFLEDFKT
jgi:hypothetical protein